MAFFLKTKNSKGMIGPASTNNKTDQRMQKAGTSKAHKKVTSGKRGLSDTQTFESRREPVLDAIAPQEGGLADVSTSTLGSHLLLCSHSIEKHQDEISGRINRLRGAMSERLSGEARLIAQGIRLLVGLVWLCVALVLFFGIGPYAPPETLTSNIPRHHASALGQLFLIAAMPACLFAIVAGVYVSQSAGSNRRVRQAAENLGLHIAQVARGFDEKLSALLRDVNEEKNPAIAAQNLSLAHMTALEAQIFFRRLKFLHGEPRAEALRELRRFLKGGDAYGSALGTSVLSFFLGALVSFFIFGEKPTPSTTAASPPDILLYPGLFFALVIGGMIYVFAGVLTHALVPTFTGLSRKSLNDALDSLRSAYTADNAPRFVEVIRRVEESMAGFQTRLQGISASQSRKAALAPRENQNGSNLCDRADEAQTDLKGRARDLPWRNRDDSVRFVDAGFQSSPDPFSHKAASVRIDGNGKANPKNISK